MARVIDSGRHPGTRRALLPERVPDPLRAHGAWVYLLVSIGSGALVAPSRGRVAALLAGAGFLGVFVLAGALAARRRRARVARLGAGLLLAVVPPAAAVGLGAAPTFFLVGLLALPPALAAGFFARRQGFLSPAALSLGVCALTASAPAVATAGGAAADRVLLLATLLAPLFLWRTWRLARALGPGWTRQRFSRRGLVESALAVAWAAVAVAATRWLG